MVAELEAVNAQLVESAMLVVLDALGLDPTDPHLKDTPRRVAKMLLTFRQPPDLAGLLSTGWEETTDDMMVVQTAIPFRGLCAHHLLPFWGQATVGYIPSGRIVGLSKLTRVVQAAGHASPSTQERITSTIADAIDATLRPQAVGVVTRAVHGCMAVRGVLAPTTETVVSALRGDFLTDPASRAEFMALSR